MGLANQPEDLGRLLAEIERRLRTLETSQGLAKSSITDADGVELVRFDRTGVRLFATDGGELVRLDNLGLTITDPTDGLPRLVSGIFTDGVTSFTGVVLYDGDGNSVLMTRNDKPGLVKPDIPAPHRRTSDQVLVTSATFVETHRFDPRRMYHDVIQYDVFAGATGGATAGELRIRELNSGRVTNAVTIAAGTSGHALFDWLHGVQVGDDPSEPAYFSVEARRTAGTLEIAVSIPDAVMTSSALVPAANAAGNARFV